MATTARGVSAPQLGLPEEPILMLLSEENGYFYQVPGWDLNCAVAGAVLAELSLMSRIDTDVESLFLVDQTKTGNPTLDPILNPNPPKDTDGRREESGRGMRELQGK